MHPASTARRARPHHCRPCGALSAPAVAHYPRPGWLELVSVADDGTPGNAMSWYPSLSADGRHVAFNSSASNLVPDDTNGEFDVFVRDRGPAVGVGEVAAAVQGDDVSVTGWTTFSGSVLSAASADGALAGASVTHRPEQGDLLVRLGVETLPSAALVVCPSDLFNCLVAATGGGAPGILYGFSFEVDGVRYEARAERAATISPAAEARFSLYRCDPSCTETAGLSRGLGTIGHAVRVSVPLDVVAAEAGTGLARMRAFIAPGTAASGALTIIEDLHLQDATLPGHAVSLAIGQLEVEATLDAAGLTPGTHELRAQACLGAECGSASTAVTLE